MLTPVNPAIVGMTLANGVHNLKLEVEDRAGNISHDFLLQITVDNVTPPVSFGLPDAASIFDGLTAPERHRRHDDADDVCRPRHERHDAPPVGPGRSRHQSFVSFSIATTTA